MLLREATSETYGPRVYSHHINLHHFNIALLFYFAFTFYFAYLYQKYYLYHISLLQVTVNGLTIPLSCWVQVVDCLCRYSMTCVLSPTGLIPWFSKLREILTLLCCITLSSSREKPMQAQEVARRISGAATGEIYAKPRHTKYPS